MNHVLTAPGPHRVHLEKTTTQTWWNPFSNEWWWSNAREKTQEPTQTTRADVTSSGNGSDDEDSSEETTYPTVFPGWDISVAKKEYAPSTTDVTSSGNGSDDEDSSEETTYPTVFPGWDISVAKKEYAPSTTMDLQHGVLLEISTQDHWNPSYTDEEEQYPSSAGRALVTNENEKRQGPTQHPLLHSAHSGWISQAQNPANTTGSTEHQEFTLPGENDIEKKTSYTAMASSHGARQNDSAQDPLVYPGWDKGEDYSTQAPVMDRIIPSRESNHEKESSNTALATPDGAHHEDSTQPPLSSDNEAGWGTEGITHPTDAPGGEVLHGLNPASTNEAGDDSLLTGTITESVDVVSREEATKEPLVPSTQPGSESEQANTTDGSYVHLVPGVFSDIDDHHNQLQTPLPPRSTSIIDDDHGSRKGNVEPTSNPGENATTTITSQPRSAQVPEWLIIVAALLALALILAVCIAVSSRRRCGQKKKLVINNGKGAVEDRKTSELNGDASKSQEMVHLVHKEQSNDRTGASDEFLTIDETQNHQELDMKSGV
nr:CD44 antigen isoform X5 [Anser cygnoides]